jgi:hypothetical protein
MRIFLLRVLVGWWAAIFMWTFLWGVAYLMRGSKLANEIAAEMTKAVWYGVSEADGETHE